MGEGRERAQRSVLAALLLSRRLASGKLLLLGAMAIGSLKWASVGRRAQAHIPRFVSVGHEHFADERRVHGAQLVAKGATHFHLFVVQVCSAVLYLEPHVRNADVMADVPKALEISYARRVAASDFRLSTVTLVERNGLLTPRIAALCAEFNALYRDVRPGDRYRIEHHPRHGVSLWLNGELLGRVGAREGGFASALFSVWFGRSAFHAAFRDDLLRPLPAARAERAAGGCDRWWRRSMRRAASLFCARGVRPPEISGYAAVACARGTPAVAG